MLWGKTTGHRMIGEPTITDDITTRMHAVE